MFVPKLVVTPYSQCAYRVSGELVSSYSDPNQSPACILRVTESCNCGQYFVVVKTEY